MLPRCCSLSQVAPLARCWPPLTTLLQCCLFTTFRTDADKAKIVVPMPFVVMVFSSPRPVVGNQLINHTNCVNGGQNPTVRPFICENAGCERRFARLSDFTRHRRIHRGAPVHVCLRRVWQDFHSALGPDSAFSGAVSLNTRPPAEAGSNGERPVKC